MFLRELVPDALDEARAARRDLLGVPPVLHRQAEARWIREAASSGSSAGSSAPGSPVAERRRSRRRAHARYTTDGAASQDSLDAPVRGFGPDRRPGRARGRDDARPVRLVGRRPQAGRRDRRGQPARRGVLDARHRWARIPVIRGIVALGESSRSDSARSPSRRTTPRRTRTSDEEVQTELTRGQLIFAFAVAIGFAVLLFKVSPALITNWLPIEGNDWFVIVEGLIRVAALHRLPAR